LEGNNLDTALYDFYEVTGETEITPGNRIFIEIDGKPVVIFNVDGAFYAIDDVCTHDDGPVGEGNLEGYQIVCPRHGARFDIRTGKALTLPAVQDVYNYPVRVVEGRVEIGVKKAQ
jgi:3-phenylpropionate/trans-cinnamate dioxygenase ferredoxin subunit